MLQILSARGPKGKGVYLLGFCRIVSILFFLLSPNASAIAQESKNSNQIIFLGKPFHFLYHKAMSAHLTLWFYVPIGQAVTTGKEVISLWEFSKDSSFHDVIWASQEAVKKGNGEMLTKGGSTSREYYGAFLNPCELDRCLEILLHRFWQEPDGVRGIYYSREFLGKDKESRARKEAQRQMDQWIVEIRRLRTPQPWKYPPSPDPSRMKEYAKILTKEGLALAAAGDPAGPQYLKEAADLTPDDPFTFMNLGIVTAMVARKAESMKQGGGLEGSRLAERSWRKALSLFEAQGGNEKHRWQSFYLLGDSYEHVFGDPGQAAECYEKALQLNPKHPAATKGLERVKVKKP